MSNHESKAAQAAVRSSLSIGHRLNRKLVFRQLRSFFALDLLLILLIALALLIFSENRVTETVKVFKTAGMPQSTAVDWLSVGDVSVSQPDAPTKGYVVPNPFDKLFPEMTRADARSVQFSVPASATLFEKLTSLRYLVAYRDGFLSCLITVNLGPAVRVFLIGLALLAVIELLTLFFGIFKNEHLIRKTLKPITELTKAAQTLNRVGSQLDPEKMAALAGSLDGINAARLDKRIAVDETQAELKSLATAINSMLDRINDSYRAQVRFVSDASHELRTPISVIQGYANLLDRWGKNDEKALQESIHAIKDEASNMKELVEQLLFLARGDNNTIALQIELIDLSALACEVIQETKLMDTTHVFLENLRDVAVTADRSLIKQALRILMDNAQKYSEPDGQITVTAEESGGFAKLSVQDDGIGIRPEALPHIFDRFYRADESRTRATGGAGLGLSIAHWIAARHVGHMEVLSREGLGTRFTIVLPAAVTNLNTPLSLHADVPPAAEL